VEPTVQAIEKEYGNKIKIVWRHMPLPFHKNAPLAAEAAQEVFAQKGSAAFWTFHDAIFSSDAADEARTDRPALEKQAQAQGIDMDKFKAALDGSTHKAKIDADAELGNKAGINGTPAFVINGYYISGAQPEATFKKLINRALKEAGDK
jgi:protein-disulfide isomerase